MLLRYLASFYISFLLALALTPMLIALSRRYQLVKKPEADRWHKVPTPATGGIAIFLAWLVPMYIAYPSEQRLGLMVGGGFIFLVGLFDDFKAMGPRLKLLCQFGAGLILVNYGIRVELIDIPFVSEALTILWCVGLMNAFNLIDNMDGLSAGVAVIACVYLFALSLMYPSYAISSLVMMLCGAIGGFLAWNFPPAKIFMGDCGSMFIGLMLAGLSVMGSWREASQVSVLMLIPLFIFTVPIFDSLLVSILRVLAGRPWYQGGKDHTSHRLVKMGLSEKATVLLLYSVSIMAGTLMFVALTGSLWLQLTMGAVLIMVLVFCGFILGRLRVYKSEAKDGSQSTTRLMLYKRVE